MWLVKVCSKTERDHWSNFWLSGPIRLSDYSGPASPPGSYFALTNPNSPELKLQQRRLFGMTLACIIYFYLFTAKCS